MPVLIALIPPYDVDVRSFAGLDARLDPVPAGISRALERIARGAGREDLYASKTPELLVSLAAGARIESVRASNAIEDVPVDAIAAARAARGGRPRNRADQELTGYADALDYIVQEASAESFSVPELCHLHRLMWRHTSTPGGALKQHDNVVIERDEHGQRIERFRPVSARESPFVLRELHDRLDNALSQATHSPVLLIGAYALDLLVIHPFEDGNGRVARLATTALLQRSGYGVGRYVSLEGIIDNRRSKYYESLRAATVGWHEEHHDVWPWLAFFTSVVADAYDLFEATASTAPAGTSKAARARAAVLGLGATFTVADLRALLPDVSDATLRLVLGELRREGIVERIGDGRGARWARRPTGQSR